MCVCMYVWMDRWMDVWMYGCMDVWMYECMDGWIYVVPKLRSHTTLEQIVSNVKKKTIIKPPFLDTHRHFSSTSHHEQDICNRLR